MSNVTVKPLEWETFCSRSGNCSSDTPCGQYVIQQEDDLWFVYLPYQDTKWGKGYPSLEAAKAAALADYEARILSAIEVSE